MRPFRARTRRSTRAPRTRITGTSRTTRTRASRSRPRRQRTTSPIRTCAGCGRKAPQAELQRFHAEAGTLVPGAGVGATAGRSVYTCRRLLCFERAAARRAFSRTLRQTVRVGPELERLYT